MKLWKRSVRQEDVLMRVGNGLKRRNKNGGSGMIRHSGRKIKLMILGLAIMLGLGGTALMFPQTVSADDAETYSKGYYKIYIDKDCFDKSIDGIYLPGVHYAHYLSSKYTDRCFVGSNPGWTWMWLCDGGSDFDFIINTPDGMDPNGVLSMEAGNANKDVTTDNPKIGKCEVNPESLNRFDREDYPNENYNGFWSFKFHGGSREYQSMTSDWNIHITRSNARLTFNSLTNEELTWDIPGDYTGAPNYEKSDSTNKVRSFAVKKGTYTLPGAKRDGYILTAWYKVDPYVNKKVKITDENVKIAGKLAGRPGERIAVDSSMDYYAYFDPIPNTATITLTNDDAPWTSTWVELYQGGNCYYTLNHTGNGVYKNNRVKNGTYDVYVRGIDTGKNITLKAVDTSVEEKMTIDFYTAKFTVMLDDVMSSKPGELTLRSGGVTYYTVPTKSSQDGSYEYYLLRDEAYDIFINGEDTGCDVSNDKREHTMEYYTVQVRVTDDTAWTNANIELRDPDGMVKAKLDKGNVSGKSVTYEKILRKDVDTTYIIYAEGHDTHATVKATADDKMAELTFYTAKIDVTCSDKNKKVNMYLKNKLASYSMSAGEGAVNRRTYTCPHLLKTMNGSYELQYHLEVTGAFIGDPCTIASTDKVKSLELYVITYKWYVGDKFGTIESTDHDKHYVFRNGYDSASAEPNISGFAFAGWGTAKQTSKDEKSYTAFDYAKTRITKDLTLYPHYMSPTVEIMGYVRDNGNGTLSATGSSFRLANISISGFELGDQSIKYVLFTTNGVKSVKVNGTNNNITWNDKLSTLTFGNSVSMAYAQDFVRKNVIFTPENGKTSTVMVTVMDKNGNASGTTDKYSPTPGDFSGVTGWTNLANVETGAVLNSGYYYLVSDANFTNYSYGGNGLRIADGAEVTIYIRPGITLTCQGGPGSGPHTGGGAGIYLPANSKLYFMGGGTVNATGGRGADGAQGGRGGDAGKGSGDNVKTGSGGRGGDGGAGAGAGIGTNGGAGGYWTGEGDSSGEGGAGKSCDKDKGTNGNNGKNGRSGSVAASGGAVYKDNTTIVNANGGGAGAGGAAGEKGSDWNNDWDDVVRACAGGAGGGGGGGGYPGNGIGAGGTGGSQGGGGGGSGYVWGCRYTGGGGGGGGAGGNGGNGGKRGSDDKKGNDRDTNLYRHSADGGCTAGGVGSDTETEQNSGSPTRRQGGNGGNGGGYGGNGAAGSVSSGTRLSGSYNVSFMKGSEPGGSVGDIVTPTYRFGISGQDIIPPIYRPGSGYYFVGWRVTRYADNLKGDGGPICVNSTNYYRQGQNVPVAQYAIGNVEFTAITAEKKGLFDDSETQSIPALTNASGSPAAATNFYSYTITTKIDNVNNNVGNITIKDGSNTRSLNGSKGVYTYTSTNSGITSVTVAGKTVLLANRMATVNFKTVKVKITGLTGYTRGSAGVKLMADGSAAAAPAMTVPGNNNSVLFVDENTYSSTYVHSGDANGSYFIYVNGTNTGKTAAWGTTTTVDYNTVNVKPKFHGSINKDKVKRVELIDSENNSLILVGPDNTGNWYANRLADSTVNYTLYIDGLNTGLTTTFKDEGKTLTPDIYATDVYTKVDGTLRDVGDVRIGEESLARISAGTYQLISLASGSGTLGMGDRTFGVIEKGHNTTLNFYTITYEPNGASGDVAEDITLYPAGSVAELDYQGDLVNGGKTFDGWKINNGSTVKSTYEQRGSVTMNSKVTARAVWKATALSEETENFNVSMSSPEFTYNGRVQAPEITVKRGLRIHPGSDEDEVITLKEGVDYRLEYVNDNTAMDRNDTEGKSKDINSINAGNVSVTVVGINDYTGQIEGNSYTIDPAVLTARGLKAVGKEYDGSPEVVLNDSRVTYTGICSDKDDVRDEVKLKASGKGRCADPYAGRNKIVETGSISLDGAAASNYVLATTDPVYVDITTRDLGNVTFSVSDVTYNFSEQKPEVTFTDNMSVDGKIVNIISEDDLEIASAQTRYKIANGIPLTDEDDLGRFSYSNNINAGKATVSVNASPRPLGNSIPDGEVALPNYRGSKELTFTIKPAPLTIKPSEVTTGINDDDIDEQVKDKYDITEGRIYEDEETGGRTFEKGEDGLGIKAVTEVKQDYPAGTYENAVGISYIRDHASNYDIKTLSADHVVKKNGSGDPSQPSDDDLDKKIGFSDAAFMYDGADHSISVAVSSKVLDEVTVYYSETSSDDAKEKAEGNNEAAKSPIVKRDAGTYVIYFYATSPSYLRPATGSAVLTIEKAPATVTAKEHTITYGGAVTDISENKLERVTITAVPGISGDAISDWEKTGSVTYGSSYQQYDDAGSYTLTPVLSDELNKGLFKNYDVTCKPGTLTVEPKTISDFGWKRYAADESLSENEISYVYNGRAQAPVALISDGQVVSADAGKVSVGTYIIEAGSGSGLTDNKAVNTGSYTVKPAGLAGEKAGNYKIADLITGKGFVITKADGSDPENKNEWTTELSINGWIAGQRANAPVAAARYGSPEFTYKTMNGSGGYSSTVPNASGSYIVKATVAETDSYNGLEATAEFEIRDPLAVNKKIILVTPSAGLVYGSDLSDARISLSYNTISGNYVSESTQEEIAKVTGMAVPSSSYDKNSSAYKNAGSYSLKVSGLSVSDGDYELVTGTGTLTVTPKPVSLRWEDKGAAEAIELIYTGKAQSVTAATSGFLDGDAVRIGYNNTSEYVNSAAAVGSYTAMALLDGSDAANYVINDGSDTRGWSIAAGETNEVTVSMTDWYYGETAPDPVYKAKFGSPVFTYYTNEDCTDKTTVSGNGVDAEGGKPSRTGSYWVKAEVPANAEGGWTNTASAKDAFTIMPAEITVKVADAESTMGESLAALSYTVSVVHGVVSDGDRTKLQLTPVTAVTPTSVPGSYPITLDYADAFKGDDTDIKVSVLDGTYKILANDEQVITLSSEAADGSFIYDGNEHTITAPVAAESVIQKAEGLKYYYSTTQLTATNYGSGKPVLPSFKDVGNYTVYYYIAAPGWEAKAGSATVTITQRPVLMSANNSTIVYGEAAADDGVTFGKTKVNNVEVEESGLVDGDDGSEFNNISYTFVGDNSQPYEPGPDKGKAGTYSIVPSLEDRNYSFAPVSGTMTVAKKELKADMFNDIEERTYTASANEVPVIAADSESSLLTPYQYVVEYSNNTNAGTATVTVKPSGTSNYSGEAAKTFKINKKTVKLTADNKTSAQGDPLASLTYTVSEGALSDAEKAALDIRLITTATDKSPAGEYPVSLVYNAIAAKNYSITVANGTYTITGSLNMTVSTHPYSGVYDGKDHFRPVTVKTGIYDRTVTVYYSTRSQEDSNNKAANKDPEATRLNLRDAGNYPVYYTAVCNGFEDATGRFDVKISKKPLKITVPDATATYGDTGETVISGLSRADLTCEGLVGSETLEDLMGDEYDYITFTTDFNPADPEKKKAGNYKIGVEDFSQYYGLRNYDITFIDGKLTVNKKQVTFNWPDENIFTYDGTIHEYKVSEIVGVIGSDSVNAKYNNASARVIGNYTASVTGLTGEDADNYTVDGSAVYYHEWSITAPNHEDLIELTLEWPNEAGSIITYDGSVKTISANFIADSQAKIESEGDNSQDKLRIVLEGNSGTDTGDYTAKATLEGTSAGKYRIADGNEYHDWKIIPAVREVSLTWPSVNTYVYNGYERTVSASMSGVDSADDVQLVYKEETDGSPVVTNKAVSVGYYRAVVTSLSGADAGKYSLPASGLEFDWSITKAGGDGGEDEGKNEFTSFLTIEYWTYGDEPASPSASAKFGDVYYEYKEKNAEDYSCIVPSIPGEYYVRAKVDGTDNYNGLTSAPIEFTIKKKPVTIIADDLSSMTGTDPVTLTWTPEVNSWKVDGDDVSISAIITDDIESGPALIDDAVKAAPGTYRIKLSAGGSNIDRYEFNLVHGYYFVTPVPVDINITATGYTGVYDGMAHGISVSVSGDDNARVYYALSELNEDNFLSVGSFESPTFTDAGEYKVYYYVYSEKGSVSENAIESGSSASIAGYKEVLINKRPVLVTANNREMTYGDDPGADPAGVSYSKTRDDQEHEVTDSGFVDPDTGISGSITPQYTYSYSQYGDVGEDYTITPSVEYEEGSKASNYDFVPHNGTLKVNKRPVTFEWNVNRFGYDGTEKVYTADVLNLVSDNRIEPVYSNESGYTNTATEVGTYNSKITGISGDKEGNYVIAQGAQLESSFEIFKTDNSFTTDLSINGWTYGDTPNDPVCSAVYGSENITYTYYTDEACTQMTGPDVAKGSAPGEGGKPVTPGTYYCVATIGAKESATVSGNNYDMITSNTAAFTIKQVNLDIYASNMTADMGKVGTPTLKFSRQGSLVGGDEINVFLVTEANDSSEPGEYPITFRPDEEGGGVVIMAADGETDHTSCYNIKTTDAKFYITEEEGDQEGVTLKSSVSGALEGAESVIYDGLFHTLDVSVMKDGVKLDESDYSIYYGRDPQTGATPESLQAAADAGNVTVSSPKLRQAGRQKVYYYVVYQNMVYSGTGTIIIEKKDLTLKPEYYECYVSDPMPLSPYNGISGEGFVNNETVRDLNAASAVYKCGYTGNYGIAGTYEITAEGFSSPNYDISYLPGTMLVKERIDISSDDCRISAMNRAYTGAQVATRIYVNGIELEKDVDFRVISGDFKGTEVDDYVFTIEGDEAYYGIRTLTWKITPASQLRPEDGEGYTMTASDDDRVTITVVNTQEITYELFVFTEEGGSKVLKKVDNGSITVDEGTGLCIRKAAREPNYYASGFTEFIAKKEPKVNVSLIAQAKDTGKVTAYVNGKESASTSSSTSMILPAGTAFTLKAEPALGFEFDKWIKSDNTSSVYPEVRSSENSIPASDVIRDQSYTAVFKYSTSDTVSKVAGIPTVENPVPNIYTGSVITVSVNHVSYEDKDLYTMTGTEGINAGTYLAEATLKSDDYAWADGTREPKTYSWQIAKSPINELPGIIKDEDKKTLTVMGAKGKYLSGQKYAYEYRKAGSAEWTDVPSNNVVTDLEPNMSYYIRIKGTNNEEPSRAVVATLGETITVRTNPPTNVRATGAVLNGNAITGSLSANELTYGFRYKKAGGAEAEYFDTAASISGNSVSGILSGLDDNTRYSYYAYVRVNATGSEVKGNEVSFTTSDKASPVPTGNISIKVDTTDEDMIPFVITVEYGNDVKMSAQGTTNTDSADLIAFTGLPYGNYNIVIRRVDGVEFTETRMLTIDSENSTVETVFTIPHGEIATVVNVEPGAPQIAVAGMPDIISQDEMDAATEGSQSTKVELKVSSSDKESGTGIMLANTLDYGREIKELFDISLYKTVTQLNNEGEKTASETIDIGGNNNKVLEIAVPYEDLDETTVIYRVHEGNIQEFDRLSARAVNESGFRDGTYAVDLVNKYIYIYSSDFSDFAITAKARTPEYTARDNSDEEPGTAFLTFVPANPGKEIEVGYVTPDGFWHPLDEKYTIGPDGTTIVRGLPAGDIVLKVRIAETDFYGAGDWIEREVRIGAADPTKDFSEQVYVIHYIFEYNGKQITRSTVPKSYTEVDTRIDDEGVKYYGISANNEFFEEAAEKLLKTGEKPKDSIVSYSILCKSVYSDGKPVLMADSSLAVKDMRIDINAEDFTDDRETGIAYRDIPYLYNDIYVYANVGAYATDKNADGVVITAPVGVKYSGLPHKLRNDPAALKKGAARKATYDLDIIIKDTKAGNGGYELVYGRDYTVTYERNTNASVMVSGSAGNAYYKQIYDEASAASKWPKITIMGKGNYQGMKSVLYFDILPISITESYESVGEHANTVKGSYTLKNKGGIKLTPAPARYARNYSKYIDSFVTNNSKQIKYRLGKDVTVELQKWDGAEKLWKRLGDITGTGSRKEVLSKVVNTGLYRVKVSGCGNYCGEEYDQFRVYAYKSVFFGSLKLKTATVKFNAGGVSANRLVKEISTKVKDASGNKVKIPASEYIVTLLPVSESARVSNDGLTALSAGKYKVHVSPKNAEELVAKYPDIVVNSDIVKTVTVKGGKLKKKMFGLSLSKEGSNVIGQPVDVVIDLNGIAPDDITLAKTVVKNGKSRIVPLTGEEENTAVTVSGNRLIVKGSYELSDGRRVDNSQAGTYRLTMYGRRGYADSVFTMKYKRAANRLSTGSLSANSAPFNAGGAMTDITVTLPDGSKETVSGTGNANFKISYKKNKAVGNAIATVTAKNDKRGYKKGSKANIGFKIYPMIVSEIHPYSDFTNDKPGELFILTPHTVKAGKKASFKIYQSSWNGKKLVAVSNKLYTGTYEASGSLANTYDLVLKSNGKAYDFTGGSITVEEAYTDYAKKAAKWTGKKSLKLSDMAALIQNANDSRSYTSDDIAVYGISEIPVMQGGNGVYRAKYAGNCYILPTIPELTVDGHELKLADGDYTISYKNNDRLGTAEVIVKLSQKTAREYGIGGSKTYTFKIVKQSDARLTL